MTLKQKITSDKELNNERLKILERPDKRPYGAKLTFKISEKRLLKNLENKDIPLNDGAIAKLSLADMTSWEGGQRYVLQLVGFSKASLAEEHGEKLVRGLLWTSVCLNFGVLFEYMANEPVKVFDRQPSVGESMSGEITRSISAELLIEILNAGYMLPDSINPALLLSMEIFSAAHLDENQRTKFLSIVSALEPLAKSEPLGNEVDVFIDECLAKLKEHYDSINKLKKEAVDQQTIDECSEKMKQYDSIRGRLYHLKKESIRQAIKRLVQSKLSEEETAWEIIDNAYSLRSQIIHNGKPDDPDIDLPDEIQKVSNIIKQMYEKELGLSY